MRKVWIVNEPKGERAILGKYGEVAQLCPGWVENKDLDRVLTDMIQRLEREFQDGDLVVCGGHAKLNMVIFHWVISRHGVFRQLLSRGNGWFIATHDAREGGPDGGRSWYIPR